MLDGDKGEKWSEFDVVGSVNFFMFIGKNRKRLWPSLSASRNRQWMVTGKGLFLSPQGA